MLRLVIYFMVFVFQSDAIDLAERIELIINNDPLAVNPIAAADYGGEALYTYDKGEDIDFKCRIINNRYIDELRLEYYNARGQLIFKTVDSKLRSLQFRWKLKKGNDEDYADCICMSSQLYKEYRYRVYFKLRLQSSHPNKHALTLYVNGEQQLLRKKVLEGSYDDYTPYKFVEGEQLNVTCKKNKTLKGDLRFDFSKNNMTGVLRAFQISDSEIMVQFMTSQYNINNRSLVCTITNSDVGQPNARIQFKSDLPESGIYILGLPRQNILYQYTNASKWTIAYQYTVHELLNLTCVFEAGRNSRKYPQFQWKFEGETLASEVKYASSNFVFSSRFVKVLDETHNRTNIQCIYQQTLQNTKIVAEVVLHLRPEFVSEIQSKYIDDDNSRMEIIGLIVAAGVVTTALAVICFMFWLKRSQHSRLIENAYEDLQNQNESPIPAFPSQWETDTPNTKIGDGVMQENYNYAGFNNRQSNTPSENHYTEIDDYFKPKSGRIDDVWNCNKPTADLGVNVLGNGNFDHQNTYKNVINPFDDTYNILNHDFPIDVKDLKSRSDVYSNVLQSVKNKRLSSQDNEPESLQKTKQRYVSTPVRNNPNRLACEQNEVNTISKRINLDEDNYYDERTENSSVYAEPYSEIYKTVTNTLYEKATKY